MSSWADEYAKLRNQNDVEEIEIFYGKNTKQVKPKTSTKKKKTFAGEYTQLRNERVQEEEEDRITVRTSNPKKEKEEKEERKWFNTGVFDDGYQFGDVTKAILGTVADVGENIGSGILGMGEKAVDAFAYVAPMAENAQFYQNGGIYTLEQQKAHEKAVEQSKTELQKFIQKDLYDEEKVAKKIVGGVTGGFDYESTSVFGEKSDSLIQSGGQLLGTMGLQAVGVPWFLTTGATSFGGEAENALNQGATWEEAGLSATISAGAEILSEKLSGGISFGGKTLDDAATKWLGRSISNKLGRTMAKLGMDMFGEGAEEVFSQVASNLGSALYKEESLDEILFSEEAFDEYIESFIGGAVLGGVSSGFKAATSKTDYVTELTDNEQKVVDKVYKDRVAEQEKNGKVTEKEKSKIYDQVLRDLEKGYISTDTIEEVLGGDTYKGYQKGVEHEDSILKEYDELGKKQNATLAEQARYNELSSKVQDMKKFDWRNQTKSRLSQEVSSLVQNDRLMESYNEKGRRGQTFEADLSQYDAKQQAVIQKAIDSGILNNTNRTHEFVDMVAKISADKGVLFDFTNNAKLKDSGFAVDGKMVNGYVTKDGVTVNIDSAKSMNSIVGHEITHVLEGTDLYNALQQSITDYAKAKDDYQGRYDSLSKLYANVEGADIDAEITADLVGDYLFTDSDFISRLSTENRNVFQKIYDEIKYLCKVATAGSKEARELERVKKAFEDAYRAEGKVTDTKYSLTPEQEKFFKDSKVRDEKGNLKVMYHGTPNGDFTVFKDGTYFTESKEYADRYQNPGASSISTGKKATNPKTFEVYLDIKKPFDINDAEARSIYINDYIKGGNAMGINPYLSDAEYAKIQTIDWTEGEDLRDFLIENEYDYDGLVLDEGADGGYGDEVKSRGKSYVVFSPEQVKNIDNKAPTTDPDIRFSLSDSDGKKLTKEQQEYFKDSKMRDEDGNLKVMYHGSQDAGFHVFNAEMSDDGTSFFFVDRNDVAASYSGTSETYEAKTIRTAADMNNFLAEIGYDSYEAIEKDGKFELLENGDHVAWSDTAQGIYEEFCWYEGIGEGDANYKVYLNLKNPLVVDAEGRNWDNVSSEFWPELYEQWRNEFTQEEKEALVDLAGWEDFSTFKSEIERAVRDAGKPTADEYTKALDSAYWKNSDMSSLFSMAADNFSDEVLKAEAIKQMTTRDYAQKAKKEGYDGVIFKNIVDIGGYGNGREGVATVAIAFESNQIKSVANEKPTEDADIRFSLSEAVEETKDLMALHNLTGEKLLKSLKLGGLPMPSVAIAKAKDGHNEFGEISLILPKETIDPDSSSRNKLYSGDAWTPTYPNVDFKPSEKVLKRVKTKISALVPYEVRDVLGSLMFDTDNATDYLNRYGGNMVEAYKRNDAMKYAYLKDTGSDIALPMKEEDLVRYGEVSNAAVRYFSGKMVNGVKSVDYYQNMSASELLQDKDLTEAVAEVLNWDVLRTLEPGSPEYTEYERNPLFLPEEITFRDVDRLLSGCRKLFTNGVQQTVDRRAAKELVRDAVDQTAYESWLEDLFDGIVEKEGIRNNKDYFTPSGNRRSFEALHYEHNLENVIKAMREKGEKGIGFGGGNIFGASTVEFSSIEDMKKSSDRLQHMSEDEYKEIKDGFTNRFFELASSLPTNSNSFSATDDAATALTEAVAKYQTRSGIANYLKRELKGWAKYSDQVVDDLIELVQEIRNMPTGYFEAKPQRAVGFDEVGVFVIPYDADVKLKQELLNRGYAIAEYDPKVEGDRQRVVNQFEEYKFSLSNVGDTPKQYGSYNVSGKDIALAPIIEKPAPVVDNTTDNATDNTRNATDNATPVLSNADNATVSEMETVPESELFPDDLAPIESELDKLNQEIAALEEQMLAISENGNWDDYEGVARRYGEVQERITELESEISESESGRIGSLDDVDAPPEEDARFPGDTNVEYVENPFEDRDWYDMKNRSVKAYMYENPEVKPFFQEEAMNLLGEMNDGNQAETWYNDELHYASGGEKGFGGIKRHMPKDVEEMLDSWHMRYDDIRKGLNAIIEDNGAENIAAAKKIEFMLNRRLLQGYESFYTKKRVPPNDAYRDLLYEKQINEYSEEAFNKFMENADQYAPVAPVSEENVRTTEESTAVKNIAPVATETVRTDSVKGVVNGQQVIHSEYEAIRPKPKKEPRMARATPAEQARAEILTEEPEVEKKSPGAWAWVKNSILDKGMVFEDLSLATGNRELQARWNSIRYAEGKAQKLIGEGNTSVRALTDIENEVKASGKLKSFYEYLYHMHNVDRMTLAQRFHDTPNKPVFGDSVTADVSMAEARNLERMNPEFRRWAKDVWDYNKNLREMAVDGGLISPEIADLWQTMYPHYVPIRRAGDTGLNVNVPLDTGRTGVNAPFKKAKGGSRDILPLFDTMGQRTLQTYRAISKNRFGVELKNTLRSTISQEASNVDEAIDSMDADLLQKGENGKKPTFTVFENGKKVTFEITDEMYNAMKPTSDMMHYTNKVANAVSNFRRGTLTEYNPWFLLKNAVKDVQDVLINSQHPGRTYAAMPKAIKHMLSNGRYYQEYMENGGDQNSYFDGQTNTFKEENKTLATAKKVFGLDAISKANNVIERLPRLAEYIASREAGESVDVAMLDAARVTTNFAAGGDVTKFFNRNGFTFLNASVQGAVQQARNIREAKMNGLKGWASLAGKYIAAGLPAVMLNHFIWDDDEEYAELSDYVKQSYYIVGKFGDGKFVRIPKGRTVAVIQNAFEQMENLITGDDEADLKTFLELAVSNLAPNNPLDNNILSPIVQVMNNETWYGDDLVPTRLQDLPAGEQYDETTDSISRWLGETFNVSPYKANYLLDQYSGLIGDTFLPMLTPEAESGDSDILAPLRDMFTTDSVLKNQNVSDFYDLKDELMVTANGSNATDEDKLKSKYINSISAELSELYQQKREIQNSDMSDEDKYAEVRDIQQQIVDLMKEGMDNYQGVSYEDDYRAGGEYARVADRVYKLTEDGEWQKLSDEQLTKYEVTKAAGDASYASDGTNHYRWYVKEGEKQGEWVKITDKQLEKQKEVTSALKVSPSDYWENKEEYDFAYESPESYAVAKAVGGYDAYRKYSSELYDIEADKDEWGQSIRNSRKAKVQEYINSLDADYYTKLILYKSEYTSYDDENYEIIEYLNGRDDISYEEMEAILLKLGFKVDSEGNITW